jgi:hypothetical protein
MFVEVTKKKSDSMICYSHNIVFINMMLVDRLIERHFLHLEQRKYMRHCPTD